MKITLCGSTKFKEEYVELNTRLSKQGHIVYSVACFGNSGDVLTNQEKQILDDVHLHKIDNSEAIVVINKNYYIGESTQREIEYARQNNKLIYFLLPVAGNLQLCPYFGCSNSLQEKPCPLCYE